jgi:glycosyltransferase involved in cell wall biosynthesis
MIGIVSRTEGEGSGAEIVLCHLLSVWDNNTTPLCVITARNSSVAEIARSRGIKVVELSFVPYKIWPNLLTIERSLKQLKLLRAVHAWSSKSFELGWYMARRLRVPLSCTMHDHPRSVYFTPKKLWRLKKISNSAVRTVAVSEALAKECAIHGYKNNITVIHNGLPDIKKNKAEEERGFMKIGFLGMNSPVKGFNIIKSWIQSTATDQRIQWHLFGEVCAENQEAVHDLQQQHTSNYLLRGRQNAENIFQEINLLVHASVLFDCYPTVLLEAARSGMPAIASSNGGGSEIIVHGKTGFLFDPADPAEGLNFLQELIGQEDLRKKFSAKAREEFVKQFEITMMREQYSAFWKIEKE